MCIGSVVVHLIHLFTHSFIARMLNQLLLSREDHLTSLPKTLQRFPVALGIE